MFMLVHIKEELQNLFHKNVDIVRLRERMNPYLKKKNISLQFLVK